MPDFCLTWFSLPQYAVESARARYAKARRPPGPGDGYLYLGHYGTPTPGYVGPVPVAIVTGRRRG